MILSCLDVSVGCEIVGRVLRFGLERVRALVVRVSDNCLVQAMLVQHRPAHLLKWIAGLQECRLYKQPLPETRLRESLFGRELQP